MLMVGCSGGSDDSTNSPKEPAMEDPTEVPNDGNTVVTVINSDGSTTVTTTYPDGSTSVITTPAGGSNEPDGGNTTEESSNENDELPVMKFGRDAFNESHLG